MSRGALWTARVRSDLGVLFLTFDAVIKVLRLEIVAQSAVERRLARRSKCRCQIVAMADMKVRSIHQYLRQATLMSQLGVNLVGA